MSTEVWDTQKSRYNTEEEIAAFSQIHERKFPKGFFWGTATASHQNEGGDTNNNWWRFETEDPSRIWDGSNSKVATDHWNRFETDFSLIAQMNNNAYRMSIEWSRIFPEPGNKDEAAIKHYHQMFDSLIQKGITPFVTIYHWTHPLWWEDEGGLLNRKKEHLEYFKEFVQVLVEEYGSKVKYWMTVNEPNVVGYLGYLAGEHAPGHKSLLKAMKAIHTLLRMHAIAYHTIKTIDPGAQVGLVKNIPFMIPWRQNSWRDRMELRRVDYLFTQTTLRALRTGKLSFNLFRRVPGLQNSFDFIGLNYYSLAYISKSFPGGLQQYDHEFPEELLTTSNESWQACPPGLYKILTRLQKEFPGKYFFITENGIPTDNDEWRSKYIVDHLLMLQKAIEDGIDVRGYFHWTLTDNFRWHDGYIPRMGLIAIDYDTLERTMRGSGTLFGDITQHNEITREIQERYRQWRPSE